MRPCDACIFIMELHLSNEKISKQAIKFLLQRGYRVLPIVTPKEICSQMSRQLGQLKVFTYKRFMREMFLPNIQSVASDVRSDQLFFALRSYQVKGGSSEYHWVKDVFMSAQCIPTQCTDKLVKPSQLIDPRQSHIASLYSSEEGRFPIEKFTNDHNVMLTLGEFGMVSRSLPIVELVERAKTVAVMKNQQNARIEAILNYLLLVEPRKSFFFLSSPIVQEVTTKEERIHALWNIPFLKPKSCPPTVSLPWCTAEQFVSPSQVFSSDHSALVFSQKPILDISDEQKIAIHCLGIDKNVPDHFLILKHVWQLISFLERTTVNKSTSDYLDQVFDSIYSYLATQCVGEAEQIKRTLEGGKWIWQDGHLLSSKQVLKEWRYSYYPYLCSMSKTNRSKHERLFQLMGVQNEATVECLLETLDHVNKDFHNGKISDQAMKFVIHVLAVLYDKMNVVKSDACVLVLTADGTLKPARECVFDDREWIKRKSATIGHRFTVIHGHVPERQARRFGVEPLSLKVAPSQKLRIAYKQAGPHESITRRIRGIVEDYSGDIDIFKELIQNADDAKATQVKFVIDWRQHPKDQLLSEELGCWQGPALLAYNNAVFSDSDFDNICKLAAETKLKDPLKTGRFGLGFCSTYYLTDVPSFVSQQNFTMFDPHTWYLKDRVTHNLPGMTIDLVKSQEDLTVYEHQFLPFDGLFGCNIFTLKDLGFSGTIFRFPFRTRYCKKSEICKTCPTNDYIDDLVQKLKRDTSNILLFLKNVEQVEVFVLDKTASHPNDMRLLFSSTKTCDDSSASRLSMIENHTSKPPPNCSSCVIDYSHQLGTHSRHHYIVASALSPVSQTRAQDGLIPLAEIAVEVVQKDNLLIPKPIKNALLFCFLPLPLSSDLPFHVNGFFDLGKDRRNLTQAQDSAGSKWNSCLVEGAIPLALECLMAYLTSKCNLREIKSETERHNVLMQYYNSLWAGIEENRSQKFWLANVILKSSKSLLTMSRKDILWCGTNGGKWISPHEAYLFVLDSRWSKFVINEVVTLLLHSGYSVLPISIPLPIQNQLEGQLRQKKHVFTYERFFREIFIPNLQSVESAVRNNQIKFVLKSYQSEPAEFVWVKDLLMNFKCIPTQCTEALVKPAQLIDPHQQHIASLYFTEEGRFPVKSFAKEPEVMKALCQFGMVSKVLPIFELVERVRAVSQIAKKDLHQGQERTEAIINYLFEAERSVSYIRILSVKEKNEREERVNALWNIPFLKPKSCPPTVSLPWCTAKQFVSPSQVFSSDHSALVFSQKPILGISDEQRIVVDYLGINRNVPDLSLVLKHVWQLISFLERTTVNKSTSDYLDQVFDSLYSYLATQCVREAEQIKRTLEGGKWIWQDGHLLSSKQVLKEWKYTYFPYLCSMSKTNRSKHEQLFQLMGVQNEATVECLLETIKRVKKDFQEDPLSSEVIDFVVHVLAVLHGKMNVEKVTSCVIVPTVSGTLKPASACVFDDREWVKQKVSSISRRFIFVHENIPAIQARRFGVEPLSKKVAPSQKLRIAYKQAGPHESITRRIRGIVEDYSGDIDIFKELIQNADDAKATQVKFVIDWRQHAKDHLLSEELGCWQGPALLAYNNAVFSDSDFDNICKLAAETKLKDPLKTGRFGLGFCSTYYLTDVPSFVSQQHFTMFDPHTWYLKDRVSHNLPGMRINLVKTQEELHIFEHQFVPFDGIFGCNIFELQKQGFPGTIFRFPFRTKECVTSEIYTKCHMKQDIDYLVQQLSLNSSNILLFLKNVKQVEVFVLDKTASHPNDMRLLFSSTKTCDDSSASRLRMIENHTSKPPPNCSSCVIDYSHQLGKEQTHSRHHYIVASALSPVSQTRAQDGLIPLAEIAVEVVQKDNLLIPKPIWNALLFCFLPLPLLSDLPFHVNGFFDLGKDRRNLTQAQDSAGSKWNSCLVKGAVPLALECLMAYLTSKCNLREIKSETERHNVLMQYYNSLWPGIEENRTRMLWLASIILDSSKNVLFRSNQNILWCEINKGEWISPLKSNLFVKPTKCDHDVATQVITLLLQSNISVLPISTPWSIQYQLKKHLGQKKQIFTYERFFKEIFLPKIQSIVPDVRNNQLIFVLKAYQRDSSDYHWVKDVIMATDCIPTLYSRMLVKPSHLIDPRKPHIASLYSSEEGRFPINGFKDVLNTLCEFGMVSTKLPISDLVTRAESVAVLATTDGSAERRIQKIFDYILHIEPRTSLYDPASYLEREERIKALWNVPFLKPEPCPSNVILPWCHVKQFVSPSQAFCFEYSALVFSLKPVVKFPAEYTALDVNLGIRKNGPDLSIVLDHIVKLIKFLGECNSVDKNTCLYLNDVFRTIYFYLSQQTAEGSQEIKKRLSGLKWIWQNGNLLNSSQVLRNWPNRHSSYLCELSHTNKADEFESLFRLLGVKNEADTQSLLSILNKVKHDFGEKPLTVTQGMLDFVVDVIKFLCKLKRSKLQNVLLPDNNAVLRPASQLTCDSNLKGEWKWVQNLPVFKEFLNKGGHFLHSDIPRQHGLELGARPLLDAVLKEIEDDSFLDGTDFGQEEDLVDRLNSILKKYSDDAAVFREFIQNADDAQASELVFVLDNRDDFPDQSLLKPGRPWKKLQRTPALCIFNNRPFSEKDLKGICQLGRGGKDFSAETIGRFGIGVNVAYHLTDCPMFVTYNSDGIPTNFCVLDPLRHYLSTSSKKGKPGCRWKITDEHIKQFPDQFQPFLVDKFRELQSLAPNCMKDLSKGFVVFRLPLVRKCSGDKVLGKGILKLPSEVRDDFSRLHDVAKESLLFLNHLKSVSYFEISNDKECHHYFTSSVETIRSGIPSLRKGIYQIAATFAETHEDSYSIYHKSKWLLCKRNSFRTDCTSLLGKAASEGLKPTGGVAVLLDKFLLTGSLFCYLPMFSSGVPVHLNGYFLVDDSRKHLFKIKGLEDWNSTIATEILVPSYVELILSARECVTGTKESIEWFYSLFPDLTKDTTLDSLRVGTQVYQSLLNHNCAVLLDQRSIGKKINWLCLTGNQSSNAGQFCKSHYSESIQISVVPKLQGILLSLGMPITCAPDYVFDSVCAVSSLYEETLVGLLTPDKVLAHIKSVRRVLSYEAIIKQNCEILLKFCICTLKDTEIRNRLTGVPLLLSMKDSLDVTGNLFSQRFASLLPHCQSSFISSRLETQDELLSRRLVSAGVIRKLPVDFVARHIQLTRAKDPKPLGPAESKIVILLWLYINSLRLNSSLCGVLKEWFLKYPILPTKNGFHYPLSLGKCVFRKGLDSEDMVLNVMKKLGYAEIDEAVIGSCLVNLSDIVSCSTSYNDVINCLCLKSPSTYSVTFTQDEVNAFASIFVQSQPIPVNVSDCLKRLPLFQRVDGSFIPISKTRVFIIPTDMPMAGLLDLSRSTNHVVLKAPESQTGKFYSLIMDYTEACCSASQYYTKYILPNLKLLSETDIFEHLKYIRKQTLIQEKDWQDVLATLKQTPLITIPKYGRVLVSDLCDPESKFYAHFFKGMLPPGQWCIEEWLVLFRQLGLKTKVTGQEWLMMAKKSADEAKDSNNKELCVANCVVLLDTLNEMVTNSLKTNDLVKFLKEASMINFIYCPSPTQTEGLVEIVTRHPMKSMYKVFTCFHDAVSCKNSDLAALTKTVLPHSCQFVTQRKWISEALGVLHPLPMRVVVDDLLKLSSCLCSSDATILSSNKAIDNAIKELRGIVYKHYHFLENSPSMDAKCIDELLRKRCLLLFPDQNSFIFVQPDQLVIHIPAQYNFQPFAYGAPTELRCFIRLLARLGVKEEMTPMHYIQILCDIKLVTEKNEVKLRNDQQYTRICRNVFDALVVCLRQQSTRLPDLGKMKCYLPSQEYELLESNQLVYNDSPWIGSRLQEATAAGSYQYRFVINPPPDENGESTPPACLGIKSLSDLAVEKLHSNVALRTNRCIDQELYENGSRNDTCKWVQRLQITLNSSNFTKGLGRLYWHEHRKTPKSNAEFQRMVESLYKCIIKCVYKIQTVIFVQDKEVSGTENTSKLCHFISQSNPVVLYITHNATHFSPELLFRQLTADIIKFVNPLLKNGSLVQAILECHPDDISKTLDQLQVAPYDSRATDVLLFDSIQIGKKLQCSLTHRDFLLICNFLPGELVVYQSTNAEDYRYGRVVETQYEPGCDITERYLQILIKEKNSLSDSVYASPLQVYKILDTSQTAILWSATSLSGFSASLTLADIPHQLAPLKKWIKNVYTTSYLRHSISLCRLSQRLVAHMHYVFVTRRQCPELFKEGVKEVLKLSKQESITWSDDTKTSVRVIEDLVTQLTGGLPSIASPRSDTTSTLSPVKPNVSEVSNSSVLPVQQPLLATAAATTPPQVTSHTPIPSYQVPLTIGGSRLSQLVQNAQNMTPGSSSNFPSAPYYPLVSSIAATPPRVKPPETDANKARIWLQQAKADLLAAHYLYNGESHLPGDQSSKREDDENSDDEECCLDYQPACEEQTTCRFPALICFLTHDVVEKCLKGVLYAKSGLHSCLVTSNIVVELMEKVEQSSDFTQQYKQVVKECTMPVCEHIAKSRYPNYQVPPCAPAEVYTMLKATEALAAATRLVRESARLSSVGELIGDLNKLTTTLSILETGGGEVIGNHSEI